ncbi:hypothetical protein Droror1_Dr00003817 [Drosera rotundifolia]
MDASSGRQPRPLRHNTHRHGPVRQWRRKWVLVSSSTSSSPPLSHQLRNTTSTNSKNKKTDAANGSGIMLWKWTPLPESEGGGDGAGEEAAKRRRFRYTPTVVIEEQKKKGNKKIISEARQGGSLKYTEKPTVEDDDFLEMLNTNQVLMGESEAPSTVHSLIFG